MDREAEIIGTEGPQFLAYLADLRCYLEVRAPCNQIIGCSASDANCTEGFRESGVAREELYEDDWFERVAPFLFARH